MAQVIENNLSTASNAKLSETQSKQIVDEKLTGSFSQLNDSLKKLKDDGIKKKPVIYTIQKRTGAKIGQRLKLYQKYIMIDTK